MNDVRFISSRLAEKMKEHGYDDGKLAEKTGIGRTTIYYLRRGRKGQEVSTSAENLAILAETLHTSPGYFVDESADPSPNQKKMSALVADIATTIEGLPLARQRELREIARAVERANANADVDAIYGDLMDLLTRLTQLKGGKTALRELLTHVESLASGSATTPVARGSGQRRTRERSSKSAKKPAQGE